MNIEPVTRDDAQGLLNIYAPYVEDTAVSFEYQVPSVVEFETRIQKISANYPYLKAVENGEIFGYAYANTFKDRQAYDWSVETTIYLREDCRRKGIGKALYLQLEESLKRMGIKNMNACIASPARYYGGSAKQEETDAKPTANIEVSVQNKDMPFRSAPQQTFEDPYLSDDSYYFHKALGFSLVGRFHNSGYKFGRWYDMIWMEKMIGAHEKNAQEVLFGSWKQNV